MIFKKILAKTNLSKNRINGKLERNPRYYHGLSFHKFQIKTSNKIVELDVDGETQVILESHLWQDVRLCGAYLTENIFKVEGIQNFADDFVIPNDRSKIYDLQFFQNQISRGLFLQPSTEDWAS